MKTVIQRVRESSVWIQDKEYAAIGSGLLILLGVEHGDTLEAAQHLAEKIVHLRIFEDQNGKMNHALRETKGEVLIVSQFTLASRCDCGRRPSFDSAAPPALAEERYNQFVGIMQGLLGEQHVKTGVFRADMQIHLVNDGPVTFFLEQTPQAD